MRKVNEEGERQRGAVTEGWQERGKRGGREPD